MKSLILFAATCSILFFTACNKAPGEGGTSSITGKVLVINLNASGDTISQYYGLDQDVYIIYGEDTETYADKFSTSLDGSFAFNHLTPGKYSIFAYSKCDICDSGQNAVSTTVEITDKKQIIAMDDLVIFD
ncbi:MAG: hypothetical protein ACI8ZM_003319 [Crocinitomix sp.]|jgi:hypothetical protein